MCAEIGLLADNMEENAFKAKLLALIKEAVPDFDNLDEDKKSMIFFDIYNCLSQIMERDMTYSLQIVEKKR